ncbi:MAG: Cna B-type domain-containing protein [Clostridium sp.]
MKVNNIKKIVSLVFIFLLIIPMASVSAIEDRIGSITIKHFNEKLPISDSNFKLYMIGRISENGKISLTKEFLNCGIDFENGKVGEVSSTLEAYIQKNKINEIKEEKTNKLGIAKFNNLEKGLYFIMESDRSLIKTKPSLVVIPRKNSDGQLIQDITINTKSEIIKETIDLKVEKIWLNDEDVKKRPTFIEAYLYKDGSFYGNITLSEENEWQHVWRNLDGKSNWTVIEKNVPGDYTVSYEKYATNIKIKNTYNEKDELKPPTTLPQTGSSWIFPQALALVGIILISIGGVVKRRNG